MRRAEQEQIDETFRREKALWFQLAGEHYGLKVDCVQSVLDVFDICPVPNTPPFVLGVLNLRGTITPAIDLTRLFDLGEGRGTGGRMIVLETGGMRVAIRADEVHEVVDVDFSNLMPRPDSVEGFGAEYIMGLCEVKKQVLIVLDIARTIQLGKELTAGGRRGKEKTE